MFQYLKLSQAIGGAETACERLPAAPAVYAWFRGIHLDLSTDAAFVESLLLAVETKASPDHSAWLGHMHEVTLESRAFLSQGKTTALRRVAGSRRFREYVASMLNTAALLQAPLYVGKAQVLQNRIRQHLNPASDLSTRLREADIPIESCVIAYALVDEEDLEFVPDDGLLRLLEEIITCICRPGFVLRPG